MLIPKFLDSFRIQGIDSRTLLLLALLTGLSVLANGYGFGYGDHSIEVPIIKKTLEASLYNQDYFLIEAWFPHFTTIFWPLMGLLSLGGMEAAFLIVFLMIRFLTYVGIFILSRSLFSHKYVPILSVLAFLYVQMVLGGVYTFSWELLERDAGFPFLLFSLYYFLEKRYTPALALNGLAFNIHGMSSLYVFFMYFLYFVVKRRVLEREVIRNILIFLVLASPTIVWALSVVPLASGADPAWLEIVRLRVSHHAFPLAWSPVTWGLFLYFPIIFFLAQRYRPVRDKHEKILIFSLAILILVLAGVVFTEFIPLATAVKLHLLRSTKFFIVLSVPYIMNYSLNIWDRNLFWKVFSLGIIVLLIFPAPLKGLAKAASSGDPSLFTSRIYQGYMNMNPEWKDLQMWALQETERDSLFLTPPYREAFRVYSERAIVASWKDGAVTTHDNRPEIAVEWRSRMQDLGCWAEPEFVHNEYHAFMHTCREGYASISEQEFQALAQKYGADYIVAEDRPDLGLEKAWENSKFSVYRA